MAATCRAIVKEVVGHGVEEQDRKRTWMADAGGWAGGGVNGHACVLRHPPLLGPLTASPAFVVHWPQSAPPPRPSAPPAPRRRGVHASGVDRNGASHLRPRPLRLPGQEVDLAARRAAGEGARQPRVAGCGAAQGGAVLPAGGGAVAHGGQGAVAGRRRGGRAGGAGGGVCAQPRQRGDLAGGLQGGV
jgi:hypothetical protein